jgi:hypothetical protein
MDPTSFQSRYESATRNNIVAPEISALLRTLDHSLIVRPWNLPAVRDALVGLLSFLVAEEGRTDGNCRIVDAFVLLSMGGAWQDLCELPAPFEDLLFDIGGQLHDTFCAPEIAENFKSLPEQLLERARDLNVH